MPTSYTSLLNLALPVTGELSGTWGDTVNDYITKYVDSSVAGTQTISGTQTAVTLTRASGASLSPVGSGSTGSSQYAIINCTGSPAGTLTITVDVSTGSPTLSNSTYSQTFAVINATSTSQSVVVRATTTSGTSTGVTMVSGERALIAWSGSDFTKIATSVADGVTTFSAGTTGFTPSTATSGAVTLAGTLATTNGGTGLTSFTSGGAVYATSTSALTTGTLPTTAGGTGLTSFTANGVVYASSSSALTTGSALTFDGTNLTNGQNTASPTGVILGNSSASTSAGTRVTFQYNNGTTGYVGNQFDGTDFNNQYQANRHHIWLNGASETMRLTSTSLYTASGISVGIGTSSPVGKLDVSGSNAGSVLMSRILNTSTSASSDAQQFIYVNSGTAGDPYTTWTVGGVTSWSGGIRNSDSDNWYLSPGASLATSPLLTVTISGFTRPAAYADTVSALGNTGTAKTIDLTTGNVFTATLTGNCTFTLSNPIATGSSSFTLILTNDGTAGRTVAWAGGSFKFPGGAASLSRTTTANAVDIWVFFTPDGGTTWYGNIAMKNMTA